MRNKKLLEAARAAGIIKNTVKKKALDVVANTPTLVANVVANKDVVANKMVANTVANRKSRHGVYKDKEARKAYQRELMRKRRAEAKKR